LNRSKGGGGVILKFIIENMVRQYVIELSVGRQKAFSVMIRSKIHVELSISIIKYISVITELENNFMFIVMDAANICLKTEKKKKHTGRKDKIYPSVKEFNQRKSTRINVPFI